MLEVGIILVLAMILFLALRNFSKTKALSNNVAISSNNDFFNGQGQSKSKNLKFNFLSSVFKKRKGDSEKEILDAIEKDQENIIAPVEINTASKRFKEEDSEVAKILYEAEKALLENDLREAEELALKAIGLDKKCAYAYAIIGKISFSRGGLDDAKEAYKTALKCDPELGEACFGLGQIEYRDENYTDAISNFQKAIGLNRGVAEWYAELGKVYMEVRQFAKAAKSLKRAASLDIDNNDYKKLAIEAEEKQRSHATVFGRK